MREESLVLFLLMNYWPQTEGGCSGGVSIFGDDRSVLVGESFTQSCEFTCLSPQHVAQLWRDRGHEDKVSLINITSTAPNLAVVLNISAATEADTGDYYCMTQPPDTISPAVRIVIADNLTTPTLSAPSTPQPDSILQPSRPAGLLGQMWFWILLGKTAILLLILFALAVKRKST